RSRSSAPPRRPARQRSLATSTVVLATPITPKCGDIEAGASIDRGSGAVEGQVSGSRCGVHLVSITLHQRGVF
ncbi:MAG: hypothetical protein ABSD47_17425, partial [Candidatus Methylomirabilota bacterium]